MKIVYLTDIHGSYSELELIGAFAKEINADLIIASGDLVETGFLDEGKMRKYKKLGGKLWSIVKDQPFFTRISPFEATRCMPVIAQKLLETKDKDLRKLAEDYLSVLSDANDAMDLQYAMLKDSLDKALVAFYCVPGNYDKYLENTVLEERDLHQKSVKLKGLKIAAYGSANDILFGDLIPHTKMPISNEVIPLIPIELTVPFNEYLVGERLISEPYEFLSKENPDLVFTHIPARGLLDKLKDERNVGSPGIARYLMENDPLLICSGHVHEAKDLTKISKPNTKVRTALNPGSFAKENSPDYGNFAVIELDEERKTLESIALYKLIDPKDIKSIFLEGKILRTEDNRLIPLIVNNFPYQN